MLEILLLAAVVSQAAISSPVGASPDEVTRKYLEHSKIVLVADPGRVPEGAKAAVNWNVVSEDVEFVEVVGRSPSEPPSTLYCWAPPGEYLVFANIWISTPDGQIGVSTARLKFAVVPRGPPQPTPVPPTPDPQPDPTEAPFPSPGLAVLILHEASRDGELPREQSTIFTHPNILRFGSQCVTVDGERFFRVWDDDYSDDQFRNVPTLFREAYRKVVDQAAGRMPWIAISTGTGGYSGPLPGTVAETLELLKRFQ